MMLKEESRRNIGLMLFMLNFILCTSTLIISFPFKEWYEEDYSYRAQLLAAPYVRTILKLLGYLVWYSLPVYLTGTCVCYFFSLASFRQKFRYLLAIWLLAMFAAFVLQIIVFVMIGMHYFNLKINGETEFFKSMMKYGHNLRVTSTINLLQFELKCCGSEGYDDWIGLSWMNETKNFKSMYGAVIKESIPWSCCNAQFEGPCYNYDIYKRRKGIEKTEHVRMFYVKGCREKLYRYLWNYTMGLALYFGGCAIVQFIMIILSRYLQTSGNAALKMGDPLSVTSGYIFPEPSKLKEKLKLKLNKQRMRLMTLSSLRMSLGTRMAAFSLVSFSSRFTSSVREISRTAMKSVMKSVHRPSSKTSSRVEQVPARGLTARTFSFMSLRKKFASVVQDDSSSFEEENEGSNPYHRYSTTANFHNQRSSISLPSMLPSASYIGTRHRNKRRRVR